MALRHLVVSALMAGCLVFSGYGAGAELAVRVKPEVPILPVGQPVRFEITANADTTPLTVIVIRDGIPEIRREQTVPTGEPIVIEETLTEPGFLHTIARIGQDRADIGAAFSPELIQPSMPRPDDFLDFWRAKQAEQRRLPMEVALEPVESPEGVEVFDIKVNALGGKPVSGYFARPKGAAPKSLPAILYLHGAGWNSSNRGNALRGASMGMLALDMNAHGIPNGMPAEFYKNLENNELKDYKFIGRESRETWYFLGMFLRALRGADFLCSQPEWDGRVLAVYGSSQGGAQSFAVAGLDDRVTVMVANVPAMCDMTGFLKNRKPGWPGAVPLDEKGECTDARALETVRYFDAVNFAPEIDADALVIVGLSDRTCPPAGIFAAYNQIPGRKQIDVRPRMAHEINDQIVDEMHGFVTAHVARRK